MASYSYRRKKRYKIKYKNVALALAVFLLVVLIIGKGCSAIIGGKGKDKDPDRKNPANSGDSAVDPLPDDLFDNSGIDPTNQHAYTFTSISKTAADLGDGTLVLVNNNIKFLGTVTEDDLVVVREKKNNAYSVKDYTVMIKPVAMDALNSMLLGFYTSTGKDTIMVNSGYRTPEYQGELYQKELDSTGQDSSTLVARAGYSEHHTGYVIDITTVEGGKYKQFDGTGDYAWINDNCHKYGYINRYPKGKEQLTLIDNEPWHFRYVGIPHATVMNNYDFCFEEYINYVKNYTISSGFLSVTTDDGSQYMIYYTPQTDGDSTTIFIPLLPGSKTETYPYEVSGNNIDGWIVTFLYKQGTGAPAITAPVETEPDTGNEDDLTAAPENGEVEE